MSRTLVLTLHFLHLLPVYSYLVGLLYCHNGGKRRQILCCGNALTAQASVHCDGSSCASAAVPTAVAVLHRKILRLYLQLSSWPLLDQIYHLRSLKRKVTLLCFSKALSPNWIMLVDLGCGLRRQGYTE